MIHPPANLFTKIICAAFAVFITGLAGELAVRRMGFLPSAAEPDEDLGWRWAPRARYRFQEEGYSEGRFNRFGMRDFERTAEKPSGVQRVALLGDSFAEGLAVSLEKTFGAQAEAMRRAGGVPAEILNFARSGMGPTEELIVLKRDTLRFAPDAVCLVYLPGNDISDALPGTTTEQARPFARPVGDGLELVFDFRLSRGYRVRKLINPLKRHSALVSWAIARIRRVQQVRRHAPEQTAATDPLAAPREVVSLFTARPDPLYEKAFAVNLAVLDEIHRVCVSNHIPLGIVVLPAFSYYTPEALAVAGVDARAIARRVEAWAATRGVACLSLQESFEEECRGGAVLNFGGPEPWRYGHFNEDGHAFTARQLAPFFADLLAGVLPTGPPPK